jgi:hypothetical protein
LNADDADGRGSSRIKPETIGVNPLYPRHPRSINPHNDLITALNLSLEKCGFGRGAASLSILNLKPLRRNSKPSTRIPDRIAYAMMRLPLPAL